MHKYNIGNKVQSFRENIIDGIIVTVQASSSKLTVNNWDEKFSTDTIYYEVAYVDNYDNIRFEWVTEPNIRLI